jgi:hypothetical protein
LQEFVNEQFDRFYAFNIIRTAKANYYMREEQNSQLYKKKGKWQSMPDHSCPKTILPFCRGVGVSFTPTPLAKSSGR